MAFIAARRATTATGYSDLRILARTGPGKTEAGSRRTGEAGRR